MGRKSRGKERREQGDGPVAELVATFSTESPLRLIEAASVSPTAAHSGPSLALLFEAAIRRRQPGTNPVDAGALPGFLLQGTAYRIGGPVRVSDVTASARPVAAALKVPDPTRTWDVFPLVVTRRVDPAAFAVDARIPFSVVDDVVHVVDQDDLPGPGFNQGGSS